MKSCPKCGTTAGDDDMFCELDGVKLLAASGTVTSAASSASAPPELATPRLEGVAVCTACGAKISLESFSGRPTVRAWKQNFGVAAMNARNPEAYWKDVVNLSIKGDLTFRLSKGEAYAALAKELLAGLPPDPASAGALLCHRLDRRVYNQDFATFEEREKALKDGDSLELKATDLEGAVRRGRTSGFGMSYLFFALAREAGLHPRLALAMDKTRGFFRYDLPAPWQSNEVLVGIPRKEGGILWLEPDLRFAPPGLVHPNFSGTHALVVDTDLWQGKMEDLPIPPAEQNRSHYQFKMDLAEGKNRVAIKASFTGDDEFMERRKFNAFSREGADLNLKETLEDAFKDGDVARAGVLGARDPEAPVRWEAEGTLATGTADTLRILPFPGMPSPLPIPAEWPEPRTTPIVMDWLRIQEGECELRLPPGYKFLPVEPLQRENRFGKVLFTAETRTEGASPVVVAHVRVEVRALYQPAASEPRLRQFLDWVEDACHRRLVLEKR